MNHEMPEEMHMKKNNKESHLVYKKWMKDNLKKPEQLKNRLYDRHISRTGRGKEISKGGSGGKYTWKGHGNLIREAYSDEIQIDNYDYDYE